MSSFEGWSTPEDLELEVVFPNFVSGKLPISREDMKSYLGVIADALVIHLDREKIRHGLWKEYPASDQMFQIRVKCDRVIRSLEGEITDEQRDNAVEELLDIINYANFAIRKLREQA